MVKHQRRSHQRGAGIHSSELDDGDTSDSDAGESPSTPRLLTQAHWPQDLNPSFNHGAIQHHQVIHRSQSFAEFGHQNHSYVATDVYGHRHSLPHSPRQYQHRPLDQHQQNIIQRQPTIHQHPYYVPEQNNPGVATMTINPNIQIHTYMPRPMPDRQLSYVSQAMPGSVEGSPDRYSSASAATPPPQELYYAHQPVQKFEYQGQHQSPIEQVTVVQYQHAQPPMIHAPQQSLANPAPVVPQIHHQYQQQSPQEQWFANAPYQEPVEVISAINPYTNAALYDPWQVKLDAFDDPTMQLPSARVENL
jgi:hypothetical protein